MLNYEFPPIGGGAANANLCLLKQYAGKEDLQIDGMCKNMGKRIWLSWLFLFLPLIHHSLGFVSDIL